MANEIDNVKSVGVEFVRQYYTMLNRAPQLLFHFYNEDSTFVYGCLDKPGKSAKFVCGREQIHNKIMLMNFNNCHTKIRQIDSMQTISDGFVIQVIGELSNDGQPLRRFLQTFVLALQSPNKYYVCNNIFRYHDEVFTDETDDQLELTEDQSKYEPDMGNFPPTEYIESDYPYHSNETMAEVHAAVALAYSPEQAYIEPESVSAADVIENKDQLGVEEENEKIEPVSDVIIVNQQANKPITYASIAKKNLENISAPSLNVNKPVRVTVVPRRPDPVTSTRSFIETQPLVANYSDFIFPPQRNRFLKKRDRLNQKNESTESIKIINNNNSGNSESHFDGGAKKKQFPNENQLFVGNLLPNCSEDDLGNIFGRFGKIVNICIKRQNQITNSDKTVRNYGFITFENAEIADSVIAQRPIFYNYHRYNVQRAQNNQFANS